MDAGLEAKYRMLTSRLGALGRILVAFSGGVDSTLVLKAAVEACGAGVLAVTAVSPAVPAREQEEAVALAAFLQARHRLLRTAEMADPNYVANPTNRCYFCKRELYGRLAHLATAENYAAVVDGANRDDLADWRPGRQAAAERAVLSPLVEAGFTKGEIRAASRALGLPTWDKPAMPCLASRFPYGTPITAGGLRRVERAEAILRQHGFRELRVRHFGEAARIEVAPAELPRLLEPARRAAVTAAIQGLGYRQVMVDPEGFRSGKLNAGPVGVEGEPASRPAGEAGGPRG
ncbi:MAG: ATP-dependent sacrificial sulfur transferase LarE [candidate division NC10 bacterium]|nr:ATP-dependent sacrificial sulfur transferase LarE [candidate division NC10 bacterium]